MLKKSRILRKKPQKTPKKIKPNQTLESSFLSSGVKLSYSKVKRKGKLRKALVYSPFAKDIVSKNPGIIKDFLQVLKNKELRKFQSANKKYSFERVFLKKGKHRFYLEKKVGATIKEAFVLEVDVEGTQRKFFIKRAEKLLLATNLNNNTYGEFFGTLLQKQFGLDIIEPHLAYVDVGKRRNGFLVSDYTDLITLKNARQKKLISRKEYSDLFDKIQNLQDQINKEFKGMHLEINKHELRVADMLPRNIFFDVNTKKLYFYDPWLIENHAHTRLGLFLQKKALVAKNRALAKL